MTATPLVRTSGNLRPNSDIAVTDPGDIWETWQPENIGHVKRIPQVLMPRGVQGQAANQVANSARTRTGLRTRFISNLPVARWRDLALGVSFKKTRCQK